LRIVHPDPPLGADERQVLDEIVSVAGIPPLDIPERPFLVCLAWQEHRELSLTAIRAFSSELDDFGTLICLDVDGNEVAVDHDRGEDGMTVADEGIRQRSLTSLRTYMRERQSARVFVGGQRTSFHGVTAGLIEEAYLALVDHQPIFLAAGFGGVTADIAYTLDVGGGRPSALARSEESKDPRFRVGLAKLEELTRRPDWTGLNNGLRDDENIELATSHRPADIAALVCLGLGCLNRRPTIDPWAT
jgi:SLOG cluster2